MITFSKPDLPHQQNQLAKRQNVRMFSCLSDIWLLPLHESVLVLPLIMMNKTFTNLSQFVDLLSCATACHLNFMNGALFSSFFLFFPFFFYASANQHVHASRRTWRRRLEKCMLFWSMAEHIPTFPVMHVQKEGVNMNKFLSLNPRFLYYLKTAVY